MTIWAATGHRPSSDGDPFPYSIIPTLDKFAELVVAEIKPEKMISGMALGWDQAVAVACIRLKIPFIAAVPVKGQERVWPASSQDRYRRILSHAQTVEVLSESYGPGVMQKRNEWMVDHCDKVLALWNGRAGGTGNCVRYAKKKGVEVVNVWDRWIGREKMVSVSRGQIGKKKGLDITVGSAQGPAKSFAPEWDWVMGVKKGKITEDQYTMLYIDRLSKIDDDVYRWLYRQAKDGQLVLLCYCRDGEFCHTHILINYLTDHPKYRLGFTDGR